MSFFNAVDIRNLVHVFLKDIGQLQFAYYDACRCTVMKAVTVVLLPSSIRSYS